MSTTPQVKSLFDQDLNGKRKSLKDAIVSYLSTTASTATINDLVKRFNKLNSTIAGRLSELEQEGIIMIKDDTGKQTKYGLSPLSEKKERAAAVKMKRFIAWKKNGVRFKALMNDEQIKAFNYAV